MGSLSFISDKNVYYSSRTKHENFIESKIGVTAPPRRNSTARPFHSLLRRIGLNPPTTTDPRRSYNGEEGKTARLARSSCLLHHSSSCCWCDSPVVRRF